MPDWGSWRWVGADLADELRKYFEIAIFAAGPIPPCDVAIVVKHAPPGLIEEASRRAAVIYCPIDHYGSAAEIDADQPMLRCCSRVVIHCEKLRRYFAPYAPVEYMDHHLKFAAPLRKTFRKDGFILWAGVRSNLPPLVEWVNRHPLPAELRLLTNLEDPRRAWTPEELGFRTTTPIRIADWSAELQQRWTTQARAAIDIKGDDFRARHKPPAKALDFIASGVPLAMNADSSSTEHLARLGFAIADPEDTARWLSRDYWDQTRRFGATLRETLSLESIGQRFKKLTESIAASRPRPGS